MKIVFFTVKHISHIKPLTEFIDKLISKNHVLYIYGTRENEKYFKDKNIKYIPYIYDIGERIYEGLAQKEMQRSLNILQNTKDFKKSHYYYLYQDIIASHTIRKNYLYDIVNQIIRINPNIIIRDSVDLYGLCVSKELKIPTISYITNNLYNWDYFEKNEKDWHIFFGTLDIINKLPENYYSNFKSLITQLYKKFEIKYNAIPITPYHNFNIDDSINIIFSTDFLQPKDSLKNINSIILNPPLHKYQIEKNISDKLINFLSLHHQKIIYLSTGSFINQELPFYFHIIKQIVSLNYSLIISGGKCTDTINHFISNNNIKNKVFCDEFLPQNYILNKANAFISSGGFNSILESIYHQTPMIIRPITCEQRMNGLCIENLNLGVSQYNIKKRNLDEEFNTIFKQNVKNKLQMYSQKLKSFNYNSTFQTILSSLDSIS